MCFGKLASKILLLYLECKSQSLKHLMSFQRYLHMYLDPPNKCSVFPLRLNMREKVDGGHNCSGFIVS